MATQAQTASGIGLVFVLVFTARCSAPAAPSPPPSSGDDGAAIPFAERFDDDGVYHLDPRFPLPSRSPLRFKAAKGDQYDNKRAADPENYSVTAPPDDAAEIRPMVEWESMQALVFAYPTYTVQMDQASETFVQIAAVASDYGEVWILVEGSQGESIFKDKLSRANVPADKLGSSIKFLRMPLDTIWTIDFGPMPLVHNDGSYAFADLRYYHDRPLDDAVPTILGRKVTQLGELFPITTYRMPLTAEGGTFQATSDGVCITSSRQLLNMSCYAGSCQDSILEMPLTTLQNHPYAEEMKGVLGRYIGCKDLLVTHSISDDRTGHIDMYLKIIDDDRVLVGEYGAPHENDAQRQNAELMDDNAAFLEAYVKPDGGGFEVARLPMPGHRTLNDWFGTYDVPFTYINSTFFNGVNLWPAYTFADWEDNRAAAEVVWNEVLPDMDHVWIDSVELAYQSGTIHCVTRTIPAKKSRPWVADGACSDGVCGGSDGGYDGACELNGASDLCWGPQWLCGCNDCRDCPHAVEDEPCGNVGWRGCCDAGDVLYCDNANLKRLPCAGTGCGWDLGAGYYSCGLTGEDPSGETSASCACEPSCGGWSCGDDGCGGSCGTCPADSRCVEGSCRDDCADCRPGELGCDGDTAWRCVAGPDDCHVLEAEDCALEAETCSAGVCIDAVEPEPDPEPPSSEPDVAGGDTSAEPAEEISAVAEEAGVRRQGGDSGCDAGRGVGSTWLLALVAIIALYRCRQAIPGDPRGA